MFIQNIIIDAIQDGKKQFIKTFVKDEKFKAELVKLVDSQAAAAKASAEASLAIANAFTKNATDTFKKFVPAAK